MKNNPLRKGTAFVIFLLYLGLSLFPSTVGIEKPTIPTFSDPTIVSIQPPVTTVETGESFTVGVYIEPGEPIIGANFDYLYFDQTLINVDSVSFEGYFPGDSFHSLGCIDNFNGEIRDVYELIIGAGSTSADGFWVNITFHSLNSYGTSSLDLEGVIVSDINGSAAPIEVYDGTVTIIDDVPPEMMVSIQLPHFKK